jgi:magnesium transporter
MARSFKIHSRKAGLSPGALPTSDNNSPAEQIKIDIINYDEKDFEEKPLQFVEDCFHYYARNSVTWINVDGTNQIGAIEKLGKKYGLHPLLLEDIVYADQRPKLDDYDDHIFIVLKMLEYDEGKKEIKSEQVSIVLGKGYVISFQENDKEGDVFDPNRQRIRNYKGKIRKMGADYLLYTLIDTVVDNYFTILEKIGEKIEQLESKLIFNPVPGNLKELYQLKREMIFLRKSVWPLRDVINKLERQESDLIKPETVVFIKDVYDHTIQIIDTIESYRDILGGILDVYLSSISNRMNSVMKVLTIISTIFMPLTFIVGIYGMNFEYMPELHWKAGYYLVIAICIMISALMIIYFKKKEWL